MKTYIGIDPGQKGGLGIIDGAGRILKAIRMPANPADTVRFFSQAILDYDSLAAILEKAQVMPKQGGVSGFNYGVGYGELRGQLRAMGIPFHEIRPTEWKKVILAGEKDKRDKGVSIRVCEQIFPDAELTPKGCQKPQDGMAEALLLAEYGRRSNL